MGGQAQLTLDDYKRMALAAQAQAQQLGPVAPDAPAVQAQAAPVAQVPQAAPMPNLQPPAPSQGAQIANSINTMSPQTQAPSVTDVVPKQGPIKSFLTQFIHGAGQGMLAHVGLPTDAENQQRAFAQAQAQAASQRATQLQAVQIQNYQSEAQQRAAQNQTVDTSTLGIPGLTGTVLQKDLPKVIVQHLQNQGKTDVQASRNEGNLATTQLKYGDGSEPGPLNTQIKDIGGRTLLLRKGTGEVLKDLGTSNTITAANARAEAMARYGLTTTMDNEGNPVGVSRLQAIQQGAPAASFDALKSIGSDKVGIAQYEDILKNKITPNLTALNDPAQRAIIAHTLAEADKNPGAIQSLLTAGAQSGLSPQGAALAAGIMQGREFGGVARQYGGNMNGTEGLMNRIMSNQASPLNSEQLNKELIQNDLTFTQKAQKQLGKITSHRTTGTASTPTPDTPVAPTATHRYNSATGRIDPVVNP
jgi:hypothetical protein